MDVLVLADVKWETVSKKDGIETYYFGEIMFLLCFRIVVVVDVDVVVTKVVIR